MPCPTALVKFCLTSFQLFSLTIRLARRWHPRKDIQRDGGMFVAHGGGLISTSTAPDLRASIWRYPLMPFISGLRIRGRLIAGFVAISAIIASAVGYTVFAVSGISTIVDRMVNLRTPVALESTEMVGNLYSTLATLRGYLLTGNPQGKLDRMAMWKEMDGTVSCV